MAQVDVLNLVNSLSVGLRDSTASSNFYTRIVQEHGRLRESLTDAAYVAGVAGTVNYTIPTAAVRPLAVFYDDLWLFPEDKRGADVHDPYWRDRRGDPFAIVFEDATARTFDALPVPARNGAAIGGDTPFTAFPADNFTVIFTESATDVQPWEELLVATEILSREFARDSDHQDTEAATMWRQIADTLLGMIDGENRTTPPIP
jgi:hypothetical protein